MATVDEFRAAIAALPAVEERVTWGEDVTYRVADRIFAMTGFEPVDVTIRTTREQQATLVERDPGTYSAAAYVGRFGWTRVRIAGADPAELAFLVRDAWRRTAPKRALRDLGEDPT